MILGQPRSHVLELAPPTKLLDAPVLANKGSLPSWLTLADSISTMATFKLQQMSLYSHRNTATTSLRLSGARVDPISLSIFEIKLGDPCPLIRTPTT